MVGYRVESERATASTAYASPSDFAPPLPPPLPPVPPPPHLLRCNTGASARISSLQSTVNKLPILPGSDFLLRKRVFRKIRGFRAMAAVLFTAIAGVTHQADAASVAWTGTGTAGTWTTDTNWSSGALPTSSDSVFLNNGASANLPSGSGAAGTLYIGDSGTGLLNVDGGNLTCSNGVSTIGNGDGSIGTANIGSGTWVNSGDLWVGSNSGTGTLNISGGAVTNQTCYIGSLGMGTVTVSGGTWANNGELVVGIPFFGPGTGTLNITGGIVTVISGTGTVYLAIDAGSKGTLNLGTGSTVGTLSANTVTGGGGTATVNFNHTGDYAFASNMTGSVAVNKLGDGRTILIGNNNYTGTTTISSGTLQIGDGTTDGSIAKSSKIVNNAALVYNTAQSGTAGSVISGNGQLTKVGAGTLTLSASNTYTGVTTISVGTLQIGDGTTDGSIASSSIIVNNASLVYNTAHSVTAENVISGNGKLTKAGAGCLRSARATAIAVRRPSPPAR